MEKFVRIVFSKWFLLVGVTLVLLYLLPANSPIPLPFPEYIKPTISVLAVCWIFDTFLIGKGKNIQ